MEQFVLTPYSAYQSQVHFQENKNRKQTQKQEKEEIVPKFFDSVHNAVNARLKTSNKKHIIELILNSTRIKLSQSDNILLDNPDTKESIVDFVCELKRKNTDFPDIYLNTLKATQLPGVFLARMDIPIEVWHKVEVMRRDFNEQHMMQVPITENQIGTMQMMEEVSDHVGMNYPEIPDSRFVAQPVEEEAGSAENPITINEDEGFSETMTPQKTPPQQPPAMEPRPALRSIENLQNFYAARQLFD